MPTENRRDRRRQAALELKVREAIERGNWIPSAGEGEGQLSAEWMLDGRLRVFVSVGPLSIWLNVPPERAAELAAQILGGLPAGGRA